MLATYYQHNAVETPKHRLPSYLVSKAVTPEAETRVYRLVVMTMPQAGGADRPFLALQRNLPLLDYLAQRLSESDRPVRTPAELDADAQRLAQRHGIGVDYVRRMLPKDIRQPNALLRPFVLRAVRGEQIEIHVTNRTHCLMQLALLDDDCGIQPHAEPALAPGESGVFRWQCKQTGIYPIFNAACTATEQPHCLLGVLMIEP
jgi:hypothetical protein